MTAAAAAVAVVAVCKLKDGQSQRRTRDGRERRRWPDTPLTQPAPSLKERHIHLHIFLFGERLASDAPKYAKTEQFLYHYGLFLSLSCQTFHCKSLRRSENNHRNILTEKENPISVVHYFTRRGGVERKRSIAFELVATTQLHPQLYAKNAFFHHPHIRVCGRSVKANRGESRLFNFPTF